MGYGVYNITDDFSIEKIKKCTALIINYNLKNICLNLLKY